MEYIWEASISQCLSSNKLFDMIDYEDFCNKRNEFKLLSSQQHKNYKGLYSFIEKKYSKKITSLEDAYIKLNDEMNKHFESIKDSELLIIDYIMQEQAVFDLLSSFEDSTYIKESYKNKKLCVKSGLNTETATTLVECIRQGRRLLEAGRVANVLAKPLIDFYAATAYSYALIVMNSPLHKSLDSMKGSHGQTYNHEKKVIEFGGNIPRGTFLDLICAIPIEYIHTRQDNADISFCYSLLNSINTIQDSDIEISLLALLSIVPELKSYYKNVDEEHNYIHKLRIDMSYEKKRNNYRFYIGDGEIKPDFEVLKEAFCGGTIEEHNGAYVVKVPDNLINNIMPCIYQDIRGDLYFIEFPIRGVVLPEICLHFLIISALCNIMRYSPHEWSKILNNKMSSSFSLLVNRYLRLFEQKFPMMVVRYLSEYNPILKLHQ